MNYFGKNAPPKGGASMSYIVIGVLLALAVVFAVKYFHDRDNGAVIQLPKVDVH